MKKYFFSLIALWFITQVLLAQISDEVKRKVESYPSSISSYEKLSTRINKDFDNKHDRTSAIYVWIATNVTYDVKHYKSGTKSIQYTYQTEAEKAEKEQNIRDEIAKQTIKKKKAVCSGYSELFKKLCDLGDIECVVIDGASKTSYRQIGQTRYNVDHAWNAVKINDYWQLVDVTWGAGYLDEDANAFIKAFDPNYFLCNPDLFFLKHYADDEQWLLVDKTKKDFLKLPLYHSEYMKGEVQISTPQDGVITRVKNHVIRFKMSDWNGDSQLSYAFRGDKYAHELDVSKAGKYHVFEVPVQSRKSGYLTIYINQKALVTFKIKI